MDNPQNDEVIALKKKIQELEKELNEERDESMWRFWRDKAQELAGKVTAFETLMQQSAKLPS